MTSWVPSRPPILVAFGGAQAPLYSFSGVSGARSGPPWTSLGLPCSSLALSGHLLGRAMELLGHRQGHYTPLGGLWRPLGLLSGALLKFSCAPPALSWSAIGAIVVCVFNISRLQSCFCVRESAFRTCRRMFRKGSQSPTSLAFETTFGASGHPK